MKQVKIIFRSGLNRVLTIDFEKGRGEKKKNASREEKKGGCRRDIESKQSIKIFHLGSEFDDVSESSMFFFFFFSLFRYY